MYTVSASPSGAETGIEGYLLRNESGGTGCIRRRERMELNMLKTIRVEDDLFILQPDHYNWPYSANVYVIADDAGFSLIDLGCGGPDCLERITGGLAPLGLPLSRLHTIVLSHAHPDHMGAAGIVLNECSPRVLIHEDDLMQAQEPVRLMQTFGIDFCIRLFGGDSAFSDVLQFCEYFGCPMSSPVYPDSVLSEGDIVTLGRYRFEVISTPGHSPGHIALFDEASGILYGGDLVGEVIAWYTPSSGGVIDYLSSLAKMEERKPGIILPAHGGVIDNPPQKIEAVRKRLLAREEKMLHIISERPVTFLELNELMFSNEVIRYFPGAGITESHVQKLEQEGKIRRRDDEIQML
jgi:glyoxylase-like metal-dependent hydrolase (beta-lactamase superfamily II)